MENFQSPPETMAQDSFKSSWNKNIKNKWWWSETFAQDCIWIFALILFVFWVFVCSVNSQTSSCIHYSTMRNKKSTIKMIKQINIKLTDVIPAQ